MNEYDELLAGQTQPRNEYDALVQGKQAGDQFSLRQSMREASASTPDRAAQVIKLSERTKLPPSIVERNFDDLSKKFDLSDNEYESLLRENPKLAKWLTDASNAAVARDDLPLMKRLENTFSSYGRGWSKAATQGELADVLFKEIETGLTPQERARRDKLKGDIKYLTEQDAANGVPEYIAGVTGYSTRQMGSSIAASLSGVGYGGVAGIALGAPTGLGAVATGTAGMAAGALTAMANYSYRMESAFAFDQFRDMKDVNDNPLPVQIAKDTARAVGAVNAIIESGSDVLLASLVPGFGKLVGGMSKEAAKRAVTQAAIDALKVPTRRAMIMSALGKMGAAGSIEGIEEFVQNLVSAGGREVAQGASGQTFKPDSVMEDIAQGSREALDAAVGTFFTFAPVGGARYYQQSRQAAKAQQQAEFFTALGQGVTESKTFERLPQKMQDFIEQATKDGPIENVYVPIESFVTYFQNKGVDPAAVANEVLGETTMYESALATGHDLVIPMGRYATRIAPTEHNAYFANEVRLAPDEMNAREAGEFQARIDAEQKAADEAAAAAIEEAKKPGSPEEMFTRLRSDISAKLVAAGVEKKTADDYATTQEAAFRQFADRAGISAEALFERYVKGDRLTVGTGGQQAAGGTEMGQTKVYAAGEKHNGSVAEIKYLPVSAIERQEMDFRPEVTAVSDEVAAGMDYTQPIDATAFRFSKANDDTEPKVQLTDGHHRVAAALQTGRAYLPVSIKAINAKGEKLNALIAMSRKIEAEINGTTPAATITVDGIERPTTNSKGQPIALTAEALTNFWRWFGDSKVVDEQGRPRVMAHSTSASDINAFRPYTHFGTMQAAEDRARILTHFSENVVGRDAGSFQTIAVYLKIENPLRMPDLAGLSDKTGETMGSMVDEDEHARAWEGEEDLSVTLLEIKVMNIDDFEEHRSDVKAFEFLKSQGYDGVVYENVVEDDGNDSFIAFYPTQAKSALGNDGTFGPKNQNILFQGDTIDGATGEIVPGPWVYSELENQIERAKMNVAPAEQWKKFIAGLSSKGVKKEEIVMSGVMDWLDLRREREDRMSYLLLDDKGTAIAQGDEKSKERWENPTSDQFIDLWAQKNGITTVALYHDKTDGTSWDVRRDGESLIKGEPIIAKDAEAAIRKAIETIPDLGGLKSGFSVTKADTRVTKQQVLDYLQSDEGGVHVFDVVRGGAKPKAKAKAKAAGTEVATRIPAGGRELVDVQGIPPGHYLVQEGGGRIFNIYADGGQLVGSGTSRVLAIDDARATIEDEGEVEEISEEDIQERAQKLWEDQLPEEAESYARDSDYLNYDVVLRLPNVRVVELPADMLRDAPAWGIQEITYNVGDEDARDNETYWRKDKIELDDLTELGEPRFVRWMQEPGSNGGAEDGGPRMVFESSADAWRHIHNNDGTLYGEKPYFTALFYEDDQDIGQFKDAELAEQKADRVKDSKFRHEVESYIENASMEDHGDHYYNQAREELEEEAGGAPVRGGRTNQTNDGRIAVRHSGKWQSSGGRDYVEIPIGVKGIEQFNAGDSTHFGPDTGGRTVVWLRAKVHDDAAGTPTLFIEEFQSQRAQAAREERESKVRALATELGVTEEEASKRVPKLAGFKKELTHEESGRVLEAQTAFEDTGRELSQKVEMMYGKYGITRNIALSSNTAEQKVIERGDIPLRQQFDADRVVLNGLIEAHQAARKVREGMDLTLMGGSVPLAPFVKDTQSWTRLGVLRAIRYAVENGIKQIAVTQGMEQVERYGNWLRSEVDAIEWKKVEGGIEIKAKQRGNTKVSDKFTPVALRNVIGKDMSEMILNDEAQSGKIEGENITITDLGMLGSYGDADGRNAEGKPAIVPIVMDSVSKELGGKGVKRIDIEVKEGGRTYDGAQGFEITPEMEAASLKGVKMFQRKSDTKRGSLTFTGADAPAGRRFRIDLLEGADLSTFIHEGGHFWLEVMGDIVQELRTGDQSKLNAKQAQMVADYDTLLAWMKVTDRGKIGTKQHEQFAEAIETYFMEGKAPSPALRNLFARVRSWMLAIYRSITKMNTQLNPEVREVFDRMLASDAEIEAAQNEAKIEALFTTAESAGMTPIEFGAYQARLTRASDQAREELQSKLMRTLTREREAWWKSEREKMRAEVAEEVNARPVQIALSVLTRDVLPNGDPLPYDMQRIKIRRADIEQQYGEGSWKTMPRGSTATDGLPMTTVAETLGYSSGDELVRAIRQARPASVVIEQETDERMKAKHGDALIDGTIHEAARAAVQNEERTAVIQAELRALARLRAQSAPAVDAERRQAAQRTQAGVGMLRGAVPPLQAVRGMAAGRVDQMRVRDIRPDGYLVAARKAAAAAISAAAAGDYEVALGAKQRELLNVELYRAATKAREEIEAAVDYMQSFGEGRKRGRIGKAGQDYLDQIDGFLDRYEFARVSLRALDRRKALATWIAEKEKAGEPVNLPDDVVVERRVNYKDMTVAELRGVRDSVKHIEHLSKLKNRLLNARNKKALDEVIDEIETSIRDNAKTYKGKQIESRLPTDEALRAVESWFGMHRKLASWIRQLDGLKDGGALWEYVMRPINEAGDREAKMNAAGIRKLADIFAVYKDKDQRDLYVKRHIPEIGGSLTKMARLMVALNWGTADNRQKLMDGQGWTDVQVEAILAGLDERDWKFVQATLDYINSFWPQIEAKEKRINGIAPEKVEAQTVTTRFGEFAGGYFPLKYDDRQSAQAHGNRVKDLAEQQMKGGYARSTTRRGHTKERVEGVKLPIRLDFGVIDEHVAQVIHDLSHHEMLIDVNRILGNKQISGTVIEVYGDVVYKQLQAALQDIAAGNIPAIGAFEKGINYLRAGTTIAGLGWNMMTSLLQPLGLTQSMVRIGPKWVGKGLARWIGDAASMENTAAWIREKSDFMANRGRTQMREINEIRNEIGINTGRITGWVDQVLRTMSVGMVDRQGVADSYFWLIQRGQMIADIPTWLGAYEKAMADPANDDARSVALADQAVLDSQGGGQMKDLATIQRGTPLLKIWTSFYSYFNVTYNLNVEAVKRAKLTPVGVGRLAVDVLMLNMVPATLGALMKAALKGDADDEDKLIERLIRENLSYMFGLMVGLRELGSVVQGYAGYEGPAGIRFFAILGKLVKQIEQGETDAAFWKVLNDGAGVLLHYPAGQVRRSAEGLAAMVEGDTKNPAALLFGPPKQN